MGSDELTVSDNQPEELRIIELKRKFREVVMKNSENIALLHSKLDEELRAEIVNQANISEARGVVMEQRLHQMEEKFDRRLLALREGALKEEMRQEIGQHTDKMNEEVKRHLADAEELHKDIKNRIGGVEVELRPLVHELEAMRGSTTEAGVAMQEPKKDAEYSIDLLPPQFLTDNVRAKLEKLVQEVKSTFPPLSEVHVM